MSAKSTLRQIVWTILFHAAWLIILALAAWWRFSLPLVPMADGDVMGLLEPAVNALLGRGFLHTLGQPFLYPGLLYLLLAVFQDFRAILIVHNLLGLGTGVLLLASWRAARRLLPSPRFFPEIFDALGLGMFAVALFATAPVQLEYAILPDSICPFFAALSIYLTIRFIEPRDPGQSARGRRFVFGAAALFVAFFLATLKPSFALSAMFSTIPIWLALFDRREKIAHRVIMVAVALPAVWFLLLLPERQLAQSDPDSTTFFPQSIFSIHALIIREQIAGDLALPDPGVPYSREELQTTLTLLDAGIQASRLANPQGFPSLGYDADQLMHHGAFFSEMARNYRSRWALQFYRYYYWRTWRRRPGAMGSKVIKQLGIFYNLDCPAYRGRRTDLAKMYGESNDLLHEPALRALLDQWPPGQRFIESQAAAEAKAPELRLPRLLRQIMEKLAATYFPGLLLYLAALPWVLCDSGRRARFGRFAAFVAVGYGYNLGNNLGIATFHTLEVIRYSMVQFATTLLTQMGSMVLLLELLADLISRAPSTPVSSRNSADTPFTS